MLTVDQRGQNYLARSEISKSLMTSNCGIIPPKTTMIKMVSTVNLNPQIVYVC